MYTTPWMVDDKLVHVSLGQTKAGNLRTSATDNIERAIRELRKELKSGAYVSSESCGSMKHILITTNWIAFPENCTNLSLFAVGSSTATNFNSV